MNQLRFAGLITIATFMPTVALADILLKGQKSVRHDYQFAASKTLEEHRLVLAPSAGFKGVRKIEPGTRFRLNAKYGGRFYVVPNNEEFPVEFDKEKFGNWPSTRSPQSENSILPVSSPIDSISTTLKFVSVTDSNPIIDVVDHVEHWCEVEQPFESSFPSVSTIALALGLAMFSCLLVFHRLKNRQLNSLPNTPTTK